MSHRAAHRILAEELRLDRIEAGLPADPSHRERKPRVLFTCPMCPTEFRKPSQLVLHLGLGACRRVAS